MGTTSTPVTMEIWKTILCRQFGAAIDMLENAIDACPDHVWFDPPRPIQQQFWYLAFHTLFWLDYYLAESLATFTTPPPFTQRECDMDEAYPDRVYTKAELQGYLAHSRQKCRTVIAGLTDERAAQVAETRPQLTVLELMLYNMRHVQHHAAQLNLMLRQKIDSAPRWVSITKMPLLG